MSEQHLTVEMLRAAQALLESNAVPSPPVEFTAQEHRCWMRLEEACRRGEVLLAAQWRRTASINYMRAMA